MLKPHKLCNVCRAIEINPKLAKDIYNTNFFMKGSSVSLLDIYRDQQAVHGQQFSYDALRNHVKKHQFMSEKDFNARHLRKIANDAEKAVLKQKIESMQVWDEVIGQGMDKLAAGELNMKTADLLKAAKDKSDFEFKVKDQQLAMMEMVMFFASGENQESRAYDKRVIAGATREDFDPTAGTAEDLDSGENRSGGVYYPPAWDAAASGPNPLSAGNDF